MDIRQMLREGRVYFDGGMGTLLQKAGLPVGTLPESWNISHPDVITGIHLDYLRAGSNVVSANTFGANRLKFGELEEIVSSAVRNAKKAIELFEGDREKCFVALDVGPLGKILEPVGDMPFERAVELFGETIRYGTDYGADLIIIETMNDCLETKAAVIAAKENSDLPIFVSNVYDENRKLLTGADPKAMIAMLEGLGVDAIGMNCSLGPRQMVEVVREYAEYASLPIIVMPNAGLPTKVEGKTVFDVTPGEYAECMAEIASLGARVLGGCCGTDPEYIRLMIEKTKAIPIVPLAKKSHTMVSSYTHAVMIGDEPILIGERINPTGKKRLKEALRQKDMGYIISEGIAQQEKGAHILDVNVGLPEIDEDVLLPDSVRELQAVLDLPLQIDSVKPSAMEKAMRIYAGKPLINSVNGKQESMDCIFPLVKKYGGTLIALTIDEGGIPDTAEGRCAIAERIITEGAKYGIDKKDIIVDPLCMTVSSDGESGNITLEAVKMIKDRLGVKTSLGVSNVSFGLPDRDSVNAQFLSMAFTLGLDCAIMNPNSTAMMGAYYTFMALTGKDEGCMKYIDFASSIVKTTAIKADIPADEGKDGALQQAIIKGLRQKAFDCAISLLKEKSPLEVINGDIVPALDTVGKRFENKTMYLPQLLMSAESASCAFEAVKSAMAGEDSASKGRIILATVKGDIHDIGKNIVKTLLENYGFDVIDLGKDVAPETIVDRAKSEGVTLVGMSALMTTTTEAMAETVRLLRKEIPEVKTVVGGAVLTKEYADMIGATFYAKDAMDTVRFAQSFFGGKK